MPITAMPVAALRRPDAPPSAARQIAALMRDFSVGATAPAMAEIAALKPAVPPRSKIHLTAVTGRPYGETIEAAARVRAQGLEPVPHLSARDIESHAALDDVLSRLTRWAGVQRMLIVGGDFAMQKDRSAAGSCNAQGFARSPSRLTRKVIRDCRRTRSTAR